MWMPENRWQDSLLMYLLITEDFFAGPAKNPEMNEGCGGKLYVAGYMEDLPKFEAMREILGGGLARADGYNKGFAQREYDIAWHAQEHTEDYLRWFKYLWDERGILSGIKRRPMVMRALEAIDAYNRYKQTLAEEPEVS